MGARKQQLRIRQSNLKANFWLGIAVLHCFAAELEQRRKSRRQALEVGSKVGSHNAEFQARYRQYFEEDLAAAAANDPNNDAEVMIPMETQVLMQEVLTDGMAFCSLMWSPNTREYNQADRHLTSTDAGFPSKGQ